MVRIFTENTLVVASGNQGKIREIMELFQPFGIDVRSGVEFDLAEPEEDGSTFIENANIKSRYYVQHTTLPCLSDDSGLVVPALEGAPGIYSARWAGPDKDFTLAMKKVEESLIESVGKAQGQDAHFVCALSLCWPDGHVENTEGKVFGTLTFPPRGEQGFGYDPIFVPQHYDITFGEMEAAKKHGLSHRANAFNQLMNACFTSLKNNSNHG